MGIERYEKGDYAGALEALTGADAIVHAPTTGLWLGKTLTALGRLLEARDRLLDVRRSTATPGEPRVVTEARAEATALSEALAARIPAVRLSIEGVAKGVEPRVAIDGTVLPPETLRLPWRLDPRRAHAIEVSAPDYAASRQEVTLEEGEERTVVLRLTPLPPRPKPHKSPQPPKPPPLAPDEEPARISPLAWVGFAFAGAGVIAGAVTGGLSLSALSDAKELCTDDRCPEAARPDYDRSIVLANAANASFAVAGAGALVGVIALAVSLASGEPKAATSAARHIGVILRVGAGSMEAVTRF